MGCKERMIQRAKKRRKETRVRSNREGFVIGKSGKLKATDLAFLMRHMKMFFMFCLANKVIMMMLKLDKARSDQQNHQKYRNAMS